MDRLLLGRFQGPAPVAIYRQAYQLLVVPMDQILSPMFNVTQPGLSILQDDATRYRRFYEKVLKVVCLISMPLSVFVAANSAEITRVILGRNWLECAGILSILSVGTFIKSPVGWSALILITRGRSKEYLALTIVQSVCSMVAMSIGVFWGITGIAVANAAATWLTAPVTLYLSFNNSPVTLRSFFSAIARPATASCVMGISLKALPQVLPPFGDPLFLVLSSLFAVATFAGTWLLLPGGLVELKALSSDVLAFRRLKVDRGIEAPPSAAANPL
jgi:PST family polysaccharide transporter